MATGGNDIKRLKKAMKRAKESEKMAERVLNDLGARSNSAIERIDETEAAVAIPHHHQGGHHNSHGHGGFPMGSTNIIFTSTVENVQIGSYNNMYMDGSNNGPRTRSQAHSGLRQLEDERHRNKKAKPTLSKKQHDNYIMLLECMSEVPTQMMADLSQSWGKRWRSYGRQLQLSDDCLANIHDRHHSTSIQEVSYQVLLKWKEKTEDASVKNLITLLSVDDDYCAIIVLLDS